MARDRGGAIGGVELGAEWAAHPRLELGSYYRFQEILDGDELFENAWRSVARHRLRITALFVPWESFSLSAALRYRSSSRWVDYRDAEGQSDGAYSEEVDDALLLHLGAQKWVASRRLRLQLSLRNVLDDPAPHHPIGPAYGLTLAVQAELLADGL